MAYETDDDGQAPESLLPYELWTEQAMRQVMRDAIMPAFFAVIPQDLRDLFFRKRIHQVIRRNVTLAIHAHIQRPLILKAKTALRVK